MRLTKRIEELGRKIIERVHEEHLTPLERLNKLRRFEETDRVTGSFAFWTPSAIGIKDISAKEYYTDPEKMYYCQLFALDVFGHDFPYLSADNYNTEPESLGARLEFPADDTPMIVEPAIRRKSDLDKLHVPDPHKDGRLPYRLGICRLHQEVLGKYFPTVTSINAPFSMAVGMRGYEAIIVDMAEDPDFVHSLMEFCTDVILAFGKAIKDVCGSFPSLVDAWSGIPNLSPNLFFEFSFPYAVRCLQVFEHSAWNFGGGHQFSGDWKQSLRRILASGTRTFMLFEENISEIRGGKRIEVKEIKDICRRHGVFLFTTIHPETMLKGPSKKIEALMRRLVHEAAPGGGHAFFTSILSGTPFEHVETFVGTIRRSTYPIRSEHDSFNKNSG